MLSFRNLLNNNTPPDIFSIPGYKMVRKDRTDGGGGGLKAYVRAEFTCTDIL